MVRKRDFSLSAERFSPAWWLGGARNVFWVVVITLLIWVYADLEISELREFTATIRLTMSKAQQTDIVGDADRRVTFSARGSRRALAQFGRWLADNKKVIEIDVSNLEPDSYAMPVVQILNQAPDIVQHGLEIQTAGPATLVFRVDRVESHDVRVRFDYAGATLIEGTNIEPPIVKVSTTVSNWQNMGQPPENLEVQTAHEDLSMVRPGQEETRQLPLVAAIGDIPVQLDTQTVAVTFTVAQPTEKTTITVPVRIFSPVEWGTNGTWDKFVLEKKHGEIPWRVEITITGPKSDLAQVGPENVQAFIVLKDDDKKELASWLERDVEIQLPPDLQLRLVGETPTVEFRLVRRGE